MYWFKLVTFLNGSYGNYNLNQVSPAEVVKMILYWATFAHYILLLTLLNNKWWYEISSRMNKEIKENIGQPNPSSWYFILNLLFTSSVGKGFNLSMGILTSFLFSGLKMSSSSKILFFSREGRWISYLANLWLMMVELGSLKILDIECYYFCSA